LSDQASWVQVIVWVDFKPVDWEINDDTTGIFNILMNCR